MSQSILRAAGTAFPTASAFTRAEEGGYSNRVDDGGNWTGGIVGAGQLIGSNMGVSAPTLVDWLGIEAATQPDAMRELAVETFEAIARDRFWSPLGCDGLAPAIALMVFDFGWNAGVGCSSRLLQRALGMTGAAVDGQIGPVTATRAAVPDWPAILGGLDPQFIQDLQHGCGLVCDGVAGPKTLAALDRAPSLWPGALARRLAQQQMQAYRLMRGFGVFGAGWEARTVRRLAAALGLGQGQDRYPWYPPDPPSA